MSTEGSNLAGSVINSSIQAYCTAKESYNRATEIIQYHLSFDRTEQKFGETAEAQLEIRNYISYQAKVTASVVIITFGFFLVSAIHHGVAQGYVLPAVVGGLALFPIKEAILQHLAQKKEDKELREKAREELKQADPARYPTDAACDTQLDCNMDKYIQVQMCMLRTAFSA